MAVTQSQVVARLITERTGSEVELAGVTMLGDVSRAKLAQIGGTGVFVSALRTSPLAREIDTAVCSLKDLPTAQPGGNGGRRRGQRAARAVVVRDQDSPLFGWQVLVPRTEEQAGDVTTPAAGLGRRVPEQAPTFEPPRTPQQIERAVKGLVTGRYQWIAFTSVNAVRAVREKVEEYGLDARAFADIKVAAVGEQTAAALREFGIMPDVVPERKQFAERLADFWPAFYEVLEPINGVLLPRAVIATETLVAGLTDLGWEAEDVTALDGGKSAGISRAVQHLVASPASLRGPGSAGQWDQPSGPRRRSVP